LLMFFANLAIKFIKDGYNYSKEGKIWRLFQILFATNP
jgi:hypothetical protein